MSYHARLTLRIPEALAAQGPQASVVCRRPEDPSLVEALIGRMRRDRGGAP